LLAPHDDAPERVVVLHDGVAQRLLAALYVQLDAARVLLFDDVAVALEPVVDDRQERAAERVEVRDGRRLTVQHGFDSGDAFGIVRRQRGALLIPRGQVVSVGQPREEPLHVVVRLRIG
jgi:hypothetical protein